LIPCVFFCFRFSTVGSPPLSRTNSQDQSSSSRTYPCEPSRDLARLTSLDQSRSRPAPADSARPGRLSRVPSTDSTRVNYMDQTVASLMEQHHHQGGTTASQRDSGLGGHPPAVTTTLPAAAGRQRPSSTSETTMGPVPSSQPDNNVQRQNSIYQATTGHGGVAVNPVSPVLLRQPAENQRLPPSSQTSVANCQPAAGQSVNSPPQPVRSLVMSSPVTGGTRPATTSPSSPIGGPTSPALSAGNGSALVRSASQPVQSGQGTQTILTRDVATFHPGVWGRSVPRTLGFVLI
jgi:hypothetical protein